MHQDNSIPANKFGFSIAETIQNSGVGKTTIYQEIKAGRLKALKCGRRTIITREAIDAWLSTLPFHSN